MYLEKGYIHAMSTPQFLTTDLCEEITAEQLALIRAAEDRFVADMVRYAQARPIDRTVVVDFYASDFCVEVL